MNFDSPPKQPVASAQAWFDEAVLEKATPNPLAAAFTTVDREQRPSSRMVLLKGFDAQGAVLYTNYESDKAKDVEQNQNVSLLFHWDYKQRQLRIQGKAERVDEEESDVYFATREKLSQVGAWASDQSRPLKSRAVLMAKVAALMAKWVGRKVPRPEHWGGYRVSLDVIEFWQGHDGRLHDRIRYTRDQNAWHWVRLQP
ncbi:MAG: pyridoxamine 5'-phosphate oxidase [Phycisphaerales bacterium]|jgi:pyridoxamine 5'-phosphate oxidase|nr:pyridoxamine 5'-phosphate oxidase [Phycisphaerales bacterium]